MKYAAVILLILLEMVLNVGATNYYVDNSGSDANSGSSGSQWQHVGYACSNAIPPCIIYATSGQTFQEQGIRVFSGETLTSSGATPATIMNVTATKDLDITFGVNTSSNGVITIWNQSNVTLSNLNIYAVSSTANTNTPNGVGAFGVTGCTNLTIVGCEITNTAFGVLCFSETATADMFTGLHLINDRIHDCGGWGLLGNEANQSTEFGTNVVTAFNTVSNIPGGTWNSGSGIVIINTSYWQGYSNLIHDCGYGLKQPLYGKAGPCGMYAYLNCGYIHYWGNTIYNISNPYNGGDAEPYEFDLGVFNSIAEGNFSWNCGGSAIYEDEAAAGCIWRWNIDVGSGATNGYSAYMDGDGGYQVGGTNFIYNNTLVGPWAGIALVACSPTGCDPRVCNVTNYSILNNIFYNTGLGNMLLEADIYTNGSKFAGNDYYGGGNFTVGNQSYTSFAAYTNGSGQDIPSWAKDPFFTVGTGNIAQNYYLQSASVLKNAALNPAAYGVASPGTFDYLGNTILPSGNNVGGLNNGILNVTNYGAAGDLTFLTNVCVSTGLTNITCPTANWTLADSNKTIEVFNGGKYMTLSNQCLIAVITNIVNSTNVQVNVVAGNTATNLIACYGTENSAAFEAAITNCQTPSGVITVPAGNYLFIPFMFQRGAQPSTDLNATDYCSVFIPRGGLDFEAQGKVTLTGNGGYIVMIGLGGQLGAYRGMMFQWASTVTNDYPVTFNGFEFNGNTAGYDGFPGISPPLTNSGIGWDGYSHALQPYTSANFTNGGLNLLNCTFDFWKGEMIYDQSAFTNGFMAVSNCFFHDGEASALNVNMPHLYTGCTFSNMYKVEEYFGGYNSVGGTLQYCYSTNTFGDEISLVGALQNEPNAPYLIQSNTLVGNAGHTIATSASQNLTIRGNTFITGDAVAIGTFGQQGSPADINSNIVVTANVFTNCYVDILVSGNGANAINGLLVSNNAAYNTTTLFAQGGPSAYGTNMFFIGNTGTGNGGGLDSEAMAGDSFKDLGGNYWDVVGTSSPVFYAGRIFK